MWACETGKGAGDGDVGKGNADSSRQKPKVCLFWARLSCALQWPGTCSRARRCTATLGPRPGASWPVAAVAGVGCPLRLVTAGHRACTCPTANAAAADAPPAPAAALQLQLQLKPQPQPQPQPQLLGVAAWRVGESPWRVLAHKNTAWLARLALHGEQPRSAMAAWLWPEGELPRAHANLRQRLFRLRLTVRQLHQ